MEKMRKWKEKLSAANVLTSFAMAMMVFAANTRCAYIFHQPQQPEELKKFRKF